jgi:carboxymethylenebutenolidase
LAPVPDISYPVAGGTVGGYLAIPVGDGPWPGVVVIHEAFGLNDDIRRKADRLAAHGYLAVAPDLYGGKSWLRCIRGAFRQVRARTGPAFTALEAAREFLGGRRDCTGKTGVVGFCMGGGFALLCAPRPGFAAAAVNYGEVPQDAEAVLAGACPIVASFGGRDRAIKSEQPERLQRALAVLEIPHDVKVYPAAGHHFMSPSSGVTAVFAKVAGLSYHQHDAEDAWQRIFTFFEQYLFE